MEWITWSNIKTCFALASRFKKSTIELKAIEVVNSINNYHFLLKLKLYVYLIINIICCTMNVYIDVINLNKLISYDRSRKWGQPQVKCSHMTTTNPFLHLTTLLYSNIYFLLYLCHSRKSYLNHTSFSIFVVRIVVSVSRSNVEI